MRDSQRAFERVVVGDGDKAHPAFLGDAVDPLWVGVRLAKSRAAESEVPAVGREPRVDVQIGPNG